MPDNVLIEFRTQQDGSSYIKKCVLQGAKYFREPQTQFCAIIPLDRKSYDRQRGPKYEEDIAFGQFETLLALPRLISYAEKANDRWCKCKALYNKYSPSMIQCDNLKCVIGWYHKKCVDLHEAFAAERWLCKQCLRNRRSIELSETEDEEIDEEIRKDSDARIQRVKTLARIWEVRQKVDRLSNRIIIKTTSKNTFDTVPDLKPKDDKSKGSKLWAVIRYIPKVMMGVRPCGRESAEKPSSNVQHITYRKSDCGISSTSISRSLKPLESFGSSYRLLVPR